jgi:hypothetical protein
MTNNRIERWATQFNGQITEYDLLQGGREGVIMLGQLSTEIQVYTQLSASADLVKILPSLLLVITVQRLFSFIHPMKNHKKFILLTMFSN